MKETQLQWLESETKRILNACQTKAVDGTTLYTPDGSGNYNALWTRDFAYMVEYAGNFIRASDIKNCIEVLALGVRQDGAAPDRVYANLEPFYHPGGTEGPFGFAPAADNSQFLVRLFYFYWKRTGDLSLFDRWLETLKKAMAFVPRIRSLVFISPQHPFSSYGFTDCVAKTGFEFFCSVLYWEACRFVEEMFTAAGCESEREAYQAFAAEIENNISILLDPSTGLFFAASHNCRQIDIWGNAYAVASGFCKGDAPRRISKFLAENYERYTYRGQVRHLLEGEYWERMVPTTKGEVKLEPDTYQNGGYWGTASGWVYSALRGSYPELAERHLSDVLSYYQENGIYEWVSMKRQALRDYVASATNVLGVLLLC